MDLTGAGFARLTNPLLSAGIAGQVCNSGCPPSLVRRGSRGFQRGRSLPHLQVFTDVTRKYAAPDSDFVATWIPLAPGINGPERPSPVPNGYRIRTCGRALLTRSLPFSPRESSKSASFGPAEAMGRGSWPKLTNSRDRHASPACYLDSGREVHKIGLHWVRCCKAAQRLIA